MKQQTPVRNGLAPLTLDDVRPLATISVEEYGEVFRIGRSGAYAAVKRGDVPGVIRIGKLIRISVPALLRSLGEVPAIEPTRLQIESTSLGGPTGTTPAYRG